MYGESSYNVVFSPDTCGPGTKKAHVIFKDKSKNHLIADNVNPADALTKKTFELKQAANASANSNANFYAMNLDEKKKAKDMAYITKTWGTLGGAI